ncbi:hypothetical protein BV22DRAFT_1017914, partial [Leucogyrophana mollusca]
MVPNATPIARNPAWLTDERHALIRGIIEGRVEQWHNGPRKFQVESWARTLAGISQLLVIPTGGGKTALFYGPLLVVQHLREQPRPEIGPLPEKPVILIV